MLTLYQMPRAWGIPNISPPCAKLETWLRITNIPYELGPFDLSRAPKGKVPFVEDGDAVTGDATLLLDELKARYGVDPDQHLTPAERGVGLAFRRMLKEDFYWSIVYFRWRDEQNFLTMRDTFLGMLPPVLPEEVRLQIVDGAKANLLAQLQQQGMGRHSREEVAQLGIADLEAVSDFLGDKPFFFGEQATTTDATVFAALSNIIDAPIPSPIKDFALSRSNLVAHTLRIEQRYFPEILAEKA